MARENGAQTGLTDDPRAWRRATLAALVAFALLRLPLLTHYPPWTDEVWSLDITPATWARLLRWYADDQTHPPLYYAMLWVWARIGGTSLGFMRLLPALIGTATAIPVVDICRSMALSRRATAVAITMTAFAPTLIAYSLELRSYPLLAFLSATSLALWLRVRSARAPRATLWWLTLVNGALLWTHFFGALTIAAEGADALFAARHRLKAMIASGIGSLALLGPWIAYVVHRARITGHNLEVVNWIARPTIGDLSDPFRAWLGVTPWVAADLVACVVAITLVAVWARRMGEGAAPLVLAVVVPVIVAFAYSRYSARSAWIDRYLIEAAVPFLIAVAAAASALAPKRALLAWLPAAWVALTSWQWRTADEDKVHFERIAAAIDAAPASGDTVYAESGTEGGPLRWSARVRGSRLVVRVVPSLAALDSERGWMIWSEQHAPRGLPPIAALRRRGYALGTPIWEKGMNGDSVVAVPFTKPGPTR
jgi:uncharacterized membrane protein